MNRVLQFAHDILDMEARIAYLEAENARLADYEEKYHELLRGGIRHGEQMIGGLLQFAMTPGVMDAIDAHNHSVRSGSQALDQTGVHPISDAV